MTFNTFAEAVKSIREIEIRFGLMLIEIKAEYRDMVGEGINTWRDFLAQPEIGLTVADAKLLMDLASNFTVSDYMDIPKASAKHMLKLGRTDKEIVEAAKTLSVKDFKERYYDIVTEEKGPRTYEYLMMKKCVETGGMVRVYEEEYPEALKTFKE